MADYDNPPPSYSETTQENTTLGCYMSYVKSIPGILKILEMVFSLVTFICASANSVWILPQYGGGFVQFTGITALLISAVFFLFRVTNLISKLPGPIPFIEFIVFIVIDVCFLISGILSAVRAGMLWFVYKPGGVKEEHSSAPIGAAAFFSFLCLFIYVASTFFAFKQWRSGSVSRPPPRQEPSEPAPSGDDFEKY